ncbi:unnamed protein product [Mytilus edulis]|uniref:Uncharacterized protein n=1 Tax=Mytilus edulis TaxID=6550 RepID=A0A8S3Q3P1_MYTED|nr:unnamed protein product [Mytilus edulis]
MDAIDNDKNCKILWRHLKDMNSTTKQEIDILTHEGKVLINKNDIANCLNDHFSTVDEKLISNPHKSFKSEKINNYVNSKIIDDTKFSLYTVTNDEVLQGLKNLDTTKSTGTDGVGPRILKLSRSIVASPLAHIINLIWGLTTHINLERIHKLQKRAARLVLSVPFDFPSTVMFKKLAWMTIFTRIHYFQAVLMFKCMNGLAPDYLSIKFTACADLYNYCLRSTTSGLLHVPRPNSDFFKRTFKYSGLITWNNLPNNIKEIDNLDTFKTNCSNYFLTEQNKDARN